MLHRATLALLGTMALTVGGAGCNLITGADRISLVDDDGSGGGVGMSAGGSGTGAAHGGGDPSGGQGGGVPVLPMAVADGVSVEAVVLYQGVSRPLMQAGTPVDSVTPVVAGREALLRVFYRVDAAYNGQPVHVRLSIGEGEPLVQQATLSGSSYENDLGSTINFDVPADRITVGGGYRVDVLQDADTVTGDNDAARYPVDELAWAPLRAETSGRLLVTLVPVQYNADGSGRLPDTSPQQLQRYEDLFYGMYPITDVELSVRSQPMPWNQTIGSNGAGWSDLLNAVAQLRADDNVPSDMYYYGIFEPRSSLGEYCGGGCVAGLGFLGGPGDVFARAAIGIGYGGNGSVETAVHELGHNHGREHAPCGTSGDPSFPYSGASIGVYGYDLVSGQLFNPNQFVDMMSYCDPAWISDYNFREIFERVQQVATSDVYVPPELRNLTYQRVKIDENGQPSWLEPVTLERPPLGEATPVTVTSLAGSQQTTGRFYRYDHLAGGVLLVPPTAQPLTGLSAVVDSAIIQISK